MSSLLIIVLCGCCSLGDQQSAGPAPQDMTTHGLQGNLESGPRDTIRVSGDSVISCLASTGARLGALA
jgi:hypothetical protein